MKTKTLYMHTIEGKPAMMDADQICYAVRSKPVVLVPTLRRIRLEQQATISYRRKHNFPCDPSIYGYQLVRS